MLQGVPIQERRQIVEPLMERVGLMGEMHRLPHELSGGQQQRVAVVRAIANKPTITFSSGSSAFLLSCCRKLAAFDLFDHRLHVVAPLEHLLRNSMVHGIEKAAERKKLKKPVEGQISITVAAEATEFVIHVEDDGAGINLKAVREKAIEKGLVQPEANLSEARQKLGA